MFFTYKKALLSIEDQSHSCVLLNPAANSFTSLWSLQYTSFSTSVKSEAFSLVFSFNDSKFSE